MEDKTIKKELPEGEQYLSILVSEGGVDKKLVVFRNPESKPDNNKPEFRANSINYSIAVWVNKKAEKQEKQADVKVENVL